LKTDTEANEKFSLTGKKNVRQWGIGIGILHNQNSGFSNKARINGRIGEEIDGRY